MTDQLPSWPTTPPTHGSVVLREFTDEDAHLALELGDDPYIPADWQPARSSHRPAGAAMDPPSARSTRRGNRDVVRHRRWRVRHRRRSDRIVAAELVGRTRNSRILSGPRPLVLFLGVATFVRLVQVQRESIIYITGLNRIQHFLQELAPASRPYFVLPAYDDELSIFRSIGSGMRRRPPRHRSLYLVVQTQGIVGVVGAAVAAAFGGLAAAPYGHVAASVVAAIAFVVALAALIVYWQRSLTELRASSRPLHPTPPEQIDASF